MTNDSLNELLTDMRVQVQWSDKATMPIPLYERIKAAITAMGDATIRKAVDGESRCPELSPAQPSEISDNVSQYNKALLRTETAMKQQLDLCGYYKSQPKPRLLAYAAIDTMATGGEGQLINRDEAIKQIGSLLRAETSGLENLQSIYNAGVKDSANRVAAVLPHLRTPKPVSVSLDDVTVAHCNKRRAQVGLRPATKDTLRGDLNWKNYRECVQCALDAAGVKYVD